MCLLTVGTYEISLELWQEKTMTVAIQHLRIYNKEALNQDTHLYKLQP